MDKLVSAVRGMVLVGLVALALGVQGCDDDARDVAFASKQGVLIEIGQLRNIAVYDTPLFGPRQGGERFPVVLGTPPPTECDSGTASAEQEQGTREFAYFEKVDTFQYTRYRLDGCTIAGAESGPVTETGLQERGAEAEHDPNNFSDSYDQYAEYGDGEIGYTYVRATPDAVGEAVREQISGRIEWRGTDIGVQAGMVLERVLEQTVPESYSLRWQQGLPGDPLYVFDYLGDAVSVDGPYAYASSRCAGGERRIEGLVYADEDGYLRSGELTLTAADEAVTLTFDDNGDATLSFPNGASAALTAQEIRQALAEPAC